VERVWHHSSYGQCLAPEKPTSCPQLVPGHVARHVHVSPARRDPNFAEWKDIVEHILACVERQELESPLGLPASEVAACRGNVSALESRCTCLGHVGAGGAEAPSLGAPQTAYLLEGGVGVAGSGKDEGPCDGPAGGPFLCKAHIKIDDKLT
jgi:hypothetical protein